MRIADHGPNAVSLWGERAAATINRRRATGTPEERRPIYTSTWPRCTAIHARRRSAARFAEAAAHAAGYTVLKTLFPQRSASYQAAYDTALPRCPPLATRTRACASAPSGPRACPRSAPTTGAGPRSSRRHPAPCRAPSRHRSDQPDDAKGAAVALDSAAQFRSPPPPALDSATWAADLAEARARGGQGTAVSPRDVENARFHTMPPPLHDAQPDRFARSQPTLAGNARLMALLWVTQPDVIFACSTPSTTTTAGAG